MSNSVDPDETAHYEPSHLDLCCLQNPIIIACGSERVKDLNYTEQFRRSFTPNVFKVSRSNDRSSLRFSRFVTLVRSSDQAPCCRPLMNE